MRGVYLVKKTLVNPRISTIEGSSIEEFQSTVELRFCALGPSPSKSALNQTVLQIESSLFSDFEGSSAGKVPT